MGQENHIPQSDPCVRCGKPLTSHRAMHKFRKGQCCILPARLHHERKDTRPFLGLDGEGQDINGIHQYVLLAASSRDASFRTHVANPKGLRSHQIFNFLLDLPRAHVFGFALGYDRTMWFTDLPDDVIFRLVRPELRQKPLPSGHSIHTPVYYSPFGRKRGAKVYSLNLDGSKFTLRRGAWMRNEVQEWVVKLESGSFTCWDMFKFFQTAFVKALKSWSVGDADVVTRMTRMKELRSEFDKLPPENVLAYCYDECAYMAELAYQLTEAHTAADLPLKRYDGPGTSAGVLLKRFGVHEKKRDAPPEMQRALACGFFGGRFENSVLGPIEGPLYSYDISSAYPYAQTFLPCLEHATWEHTTDRNAIDSARAALVRYGYGEPSNKHDFCSWAPFPFRTSNGSIAFPSTSGGGWVWRYEYLEGERLFPHVYFREAWILKSDCDCQVFSDLPALYRERIRIGKEARGIVLKLAMNSCYGKLAQSVGRAPYNSWIWAGLITSNTRAMILTMLGLHKDRSNLLSAATDGIYTREKLTPPIPRDTGTFDLAKPLGGWEEKTCKGATFFARPGIYFPCILTPDDVEAVRARGVGRKELYEHHTGIIEACARGEMTYDIPSVRRFRGAKTSIHRSGKPGERTYKRAPNYGQWVPWPLSMSFNPQPKRERVLADKTLELRAFSDSEESLPYSKSLLSPDARAALLELVWLSEQPDAREYDYNPAYPILDTVDVAAFA